MTIIIKIMHALFITGLLISGTVNAAQTNDTQLKGRFSIASVGSGGGLWYVINNNGWRKLHPLTAEKLVVGDFDGNGVDDVVISFGTKGGLWRWMNNKNWQKLYPVGATQIVVADLDDNGQDDVIISFGQAGTWRWMNNENWQKLHSAEATQMVVADLDDNGQDDIVISFSPGGIWRWMNNSSWQRLHPLSSQHMVTGDFDGNDVDDIVISFGSAGLWRWMNNNSWQKLHPSGAKQLVVGDLDSNGKDDVVISFDFGLWRWMNNKNWRFLHPTPATKMFVVAWEFFGPDDVVIEFASGAGTWQWDNNENWKNLKNFKIAGLVVGNLGEIKRVSSGSSNNASSTQTGSNVFSKTDIFWKTPETTTISVKVENASYRIPVRSMHMTLTITNIGNSAIRLGEFNTASVRFLDADVFQDDAGTYPADLLAENGLSVSDNSPIQPGETRIVEITASGAAQEVYRLSELTNDSGKRFAGFLYFFDEAGNLRKVRVEAPITMISTQKALPKAIEKEFIGIWEGSAFQYNIKSSWTIKITITKDKQTIVYPSLRCGGRLELISQNKDSIVFQEILTYGLLKCVNNGQVILKKKSTSELQYVWFYPSGKKGADGVVTKISTLDIISDNEWKEYGEVVIESLLMNGLKIPDNIAFIVSDVVIYIGKKLPTKAARKYMLSPRKTFGWAAQIIKQEGDINISKMTFFGDLVVSAVIDAAVHKIREDYDPSFKDRWFGKWREEVTKEFFVWSIRQASVAYAAKNGGIHAAIASETMVSGKTVWETSKAVSDVVTLYLNNNKLDKTNKIGDRFLELRYAYLKESDKEKKEKRLLELEKYLQEEGKILFEGKDDFDENLKEYIRNLVRFHALDN